MALSWLHKFVSAKADGTDSTLIKPSNWNDQHAVTTDTDGIMLGRPVGAGAGDIVAMDIATTVINTIIPAGVVLAYAGATVPTGWLICNGQLVSRTTEARIFAAIGTTYGVGDGSTTFAIPDLRGRVPAHVDGGAGRLPGWVLGTGGGALTAQPRCYGNVDVSVTVSGTVIVYGTVSGGASAGSGSGAGTNFAQGQVVTSNGGNSMGGSGSGSLRNDGGNVTDQFNLVQPTMTMNYIIKR